MRTIPFGLIACSSVAQRRFLPALKAANYARLARIGSRDTTKAKQFAQEFLCTKYGSYEDVLNDSEIEAVYISTPPSLHAEWIYKSASAQKHILCEKPAFLSVEQARKAITMCRENGVRLLEGYAFKYHPQHAIVRSLIAKGHIGQPRFFMAEYSYPRPNSDDIRLKSELGGGVLYDSAGYPVAASLMQFSNQPISVSCEQGRDVTAGVDDSFALTIRFSGGEIAQIYVAFGVSYRSRYSIAGTCGRIEVERAFSVPAGKEVSISVETESGVEKIRVEPVDQFRMMIDGFCDSITGLNSGKINLEDDLLQLRSVMDAAELSSREHRTVEIKNI